jgi:hypothetical protein
MRSLSFMAHLSRIVVVSDRSTSRATQPGGACWQRNCNWRRIPTTEHDPMTPLDHPLRREILVDDTPYTLLLTAQGLRLTQKGHRKGVELSWRDLVSGDAAVATALRASLE